jgi:exodeoxyribonuclease-5
MPSEKPEEDIVQVLGVDDTVAELAPTPVADLPALSDLSDDQRVVYTTALDWAKAEGALGKLLTLGGYAGTGKTTLVSLLGRELGRAGIAVGYIAYTGKAANVLRRKLRAAGVEALYVGTIHSLLYEPIIDQHTQRVLSWQKRPDLDDFQLLVVDEASMVDQDVFNDLASYGVPILAVGDHGQLPPVHGSFNLMERPMLRLEQIHRQAEGSPILALSALIRERGALPRSFDGQDQVRLWEREALDILLDRACNDRSQIHRTAALCYRNQTRVGLNMAIRERLGYEGGPGPGEWTICLRNAKPGGIRIANGQRALIEHAEVATPHQARMRLRFPDDRLLLTTRVCRHQFGQSVTFSDLSVVRETFGLHAKTWPELGLLLDWGYALTGHKAQGDQWPEVIVVVEVPSRTDADTMRRWLYTATTRAEHTLHLVVDSTTPFA